MEMKLALAEATAGWGDDEIYLVTRTMQATPDTSMKNYIDVKQMAECLKDGFADYFSRFDVLLTCVQLIPS